MELSKSIIVDTPIEEFKVNGISVFIKREDLACLPPGPPFAKIRGLYPRLSTLQKRGIKTVGYMETTVSMAGWGISYFCQQFGMRAIIFEPKYKDGKDHELQAKHRSIWYRFGAEIIPLENPNRLSINFYKARKILSKNWKDSFMLPQGLPFEETIVDVSKQVITTIPSSLLGGTIVSSVGSGTMLSGVIRGLIDRGGYKTQTFGILVSPKGAERMKKEIMKKVNRFAPNNYPLTIVDAGYQYTEEENYECPFPCSKYYDRKAWKWIVGNIEKLKPPILFWNIGGDTVDR